ncbi:hypothetical protein D3C81_1840270 [compost metagenome]
MRNRHADLVQTRGPAQQGEVVVAALVRRIGELGEQFARGQPYPAGLRAVHAVAAHELVDGDRAHVLVVATAEQVVQHAQP